MSITDTAVDEGLAFLERNRETTDSPMLATAGLTWGLLRALFECPNCPGSFLVPLTPDATLADMGGTFGCQRCGEAWQWVEPAPEKPKRTRRGSRHA